MTDLLQKLGGKKRLIAGIVLGVALALLAIWFCNTVYDPFAGQIEDLLVFVPPEADFVLEAPDFPTLIKGLEDRPFFSRLDRNRDFQRFLASSKVVETRIFPALQKGYRQLNKLDLDLPFDLEVIGDLSGTQVMLAGHAPGDGEPVRFVAALKPQSAWAIVGANLLLDEQLCDWFVRDELVGVEIEHFNWGAKLKLVHEGEPLELGVSRVEDAIVVGTDVAAVSRAVRLAKTEGLPPLRTQRVDPRWVWDGAHDTSINLLLRRDLFDREVDLYDRYLVPLWGPQLAAAFERCFPAFEGRDLYAKLDLHDFARILALTPARPRRPADPFSAMQPLDIGAVYGQINGVLAKLPHNVFGYAYLASDPADLLSFVFREEALVNTDERQLLSEMLAERVPRFRRPQNPDGSVGDMTPDLVREIKRCVGSEIGLVMFGKDRSERVPDSAAGVACVMRVRDRGALEELIGELDASLEYPFERYDHGDIVLWHISQKSWLDDPELTDPGFGIIGDYFIVTNWFRLLRDAVEVDRGAKTGFGARAQLDYNLDHLEPDSRGFLFLDPDRLYAFMDEAKEGWIAERSEISEAEKVHARRGLEVRAQVEGIDPAERDDWLDREYDAWLARVRREKNPVVIRREIEANLDYFRSAFSFFFCSVGQIGDSLALEVRLGAREQF